MNKIMTHVVAGYPDKEKSIELMQGMERAGVGMIEVQIPFSDPVADGETIMRANDAALHHGMTVEASFELIVKAELEADIYIMSYFQKVLHCGTKNICELAARSGIRGFIIPDLPYDAPEFNEFLDCANKNNLVYVPVISPEMSEKRLRGSLLNATELIYLTSMKGITGKGLKIDEELVDTAKKVKKIKPGSRLAIGFGISSRDDLQRVLQIADVGIVGSAVIRKIDSEGVESAISFVSQLARP